MWGAAVDAPCSPEAPCVHLVPHTHLDPGWRDTFEGYHRSFASRIHPSVVLALAADHRKRFAFADISFLARWLEESGDARVPSTCAYDPRRPTSPRDVTVLDASWRPERRGARAAKAFAAEKTACPETWSALCRRLVREGRLDVVGGGWVSHDEATTPVDLAAAQYDEGMRTVRALFFEEQTDRRFDGDDEFADADVAEASATAWQIDPFGHAAATPAILAHLGFERVVLNRVPAATRARLIRENAREFTWTSRDASESASDSAAPRERSVAAHVLRAHYNVPPELDFERRRVVLNADGTLRADLVRLAAAALLKTAEAASQGVRHGHALVLVGDDFRFADAAATFDAWRDALAGAEKSFPRAARKRDAVSRARRVGPERLEPETEPSAPRFRWSTPREYFAAANAATRALAPPTRRGAFFPYADNFPASENAWVGGYVARRALKDAVLEAATSAVVASSLAASLPRAEEGSNASRGFAANLARDVRAARRDGVLGLHHDAITGTCPAHVAEDTFRIASRAVTASRRAIRAAATVALECDEEPVADVAEDASDASGVPFLARGGDAFAVHNPRGDAAGAAVVTVRVARGLALVDARDAESARRRTPLPTQSAFGPGKGDARGDDGDASVVVVAAPPPLGVTVVVAVDRASLETEASRSGLADAGASAREPTSALRPEDMGVAFDATGATISFTAGNGEKVFARLSAASVAFPRDEHFGDGPYVSRSAAAHVFVVWVGSVLGYVVGDCVARCVLAARARATGKTASRRGAFFTQRKQRRRREDGVVRSFFVSLASRSRRRSALRGSRGTRVDEVDDAPAFMSDDDDDDPKKKEDGSRSRRTSTFGANDVDRFGEARVACAFAVGAAFPLFVWSPGLVSHVAYRALLDAGLKGTGAFLTVGAPFGAVARGARALGAPAARRRRNGGTSRSRPSLCRARVSVARRRGDVRLPARGRLRALARRAASAGARRRRARVPPRRRVFRVRARVRRRRRSRRARTLRAPRRPRRLRRRRFVCTAAARRVGRDCAVGFRNRRARRVARRERRRDANRHESISAFPGRRRRRPRGVTPAEASRRVQKRVVRRGALGAVRAVRRVRARTTRRKEPFFVVFVASARKPFRDRLRARGKLRVSGTVVRHLRRAPQRALGRRPRARRARRTRARRSTRLVRRAARAPGVPARRAARRVERRV